MKIVLTGGGTGGHIYPAISVGQALRELRPDVDLLFVGSSHGPEGNLATAAGIPFLAVPSSPLTKSVTFSNLRSLCRLVAGVFRARKMLKVFEPDVVIGTGGYTTAAVLLAARSLGKPIVIHEQNAVPGRTNRWLARLADKVCITLESSAAFFPKDKVAATGMPVRKEFAQMPEKADARGALELDERLFTVLVVGGSQGAKRLNELVIDMWPLVDNGNVQVVHQVGERNLSRAQALLAEKAPEPGNRYKMLAYLDMPLALAAADLVICRSGASTIAEVTAAGLPSILVPFPYAHADHQKLNAQYVVSKGAGVMHEESNTTSESLAKTVNDLIANQEKLAAMASASKSLGNESAAKDVAKVALELVV